MNFLCSQPEDGQTETPLDEVFRRFCNTEDYGTEYKQKKLNSDDQLAVDTVQQGSRQLEIGYEVALPWRLPRIELPMNRKLAEHRLQGLIRRFQRDPAYKKDYKLAMQKYVDQGYASKVPPELLNIADQYFLNHHGVYKKGSKKLRIVFDSAAKYRGRCLNDALLSGPAWQNKLPSVLIHFREGAVAFAADIEAMFSRIRLRPEDAAYHRFLWAEEDGSVTTYQMDRLAFGDKCSPFVAIATTRQAAADHGEESQEIIKAITDHLYMDDYLDSTRTEEEAIVRAKGVTKTLAKGDFIFQAWVSNSPTFLAAVSPTTTKAAADGRMLGDTNSQAKVLGVGWNPANDMLSFVISPPENVTFTRLGILSLVSGVFDPMGLAAPWIIKAKIKMREMDIRGLAWDEAIPPDIVSWWQDWILSLQQLSSQKIPRCLFPDEDELIKTELHIFSDASEEAFAAAVYVRNQYVNGRVLVRLLIAKTKIGPKKVLSIPKMELQGALMGARLAEYVKSAVTRPITQRKFWTDSSCVRGWIRSTAAYYKVFVSHRLGEIQTLTNANEWRFVPGRSN